MGYIEPFYLNRNSLLGRAEYAQIDIPQTRQILQKEVRSRSGKAAASLLGTGIGVGGDKGTVFETQSTFTMDPSDNSVVSTVLDGLQSRNEIKEYAPGISSVRNDWVEVTCDFKLTESSQLGRFVAVFMAAMNHQDVSLTSLPEIEDLPADSLQAIKEVLLTSDLQAIDFLVESPGTSERPNIYVNFPPGHFVEGANLRHLESEYTVVGKVRKMLPESDDGFVSAEEWLLPGVPRIARRLLMASIDDLSSAFSDLFAEGVEDNVAPQGSALAYLSGPALILDAIAAY